MNAKAHDVDLSHSRRKIAKNSNPVEVWLLDDRNQGRQIVSVLCTMLLGSGCTEHLSPRALLTTLRIPTSPVGYLLSSPSPGPAWRPIANTIAGHERMISK